MINFNWRARNNSLPLIKAKNLPTRKIILKKETFPLGKSIKIKNPPPAGHYSFAYTPTFAGSTWTTSFAFNTNSSSTHTFIIDNISMCAANAVQPITSYSADVLMHTDYYGFGMQQPGRTWIASDYRYSHKSHEKEDALFKGAQSAEFWMYDSRIGRRWERDPIVDEALSPYACFNNNPILLNDLLGLSPGGGDKSKAMNSKKHVHNENGHFKRKSDGKYHKVGGGKDGANTAADATAVKQPHNIPRESSGGSKPAPMGNYTDNDNWLISYSPNLQSASTLNTQNQPYVWSTREPSVLSTIKFPSTGLTSLGVGFKGIGLSYNFDDGSIGVSGSKTLNKKHNVNFSFGTSGAGFGAKNVDLGFAGYGREVDVLSYKVHFASANYNKLVDLGYGYKFYAAYKVVNIVTVYDQVSALGRQIMHITQYRIESYPNSPYGTVSGQQYTSKDTVVKNQTVGFSSGFGGAITIQTK